MRGAMENSDEVVTWIVMLTLVSQEVEEILTGRRRAAVSLSLLY